jgi:hypothetical protein
MPLIAHSASIGQNLGLSSEHIHAADVFVLLTLATLFFVLGVGATCAWILWRRAHFPKPHIRLLMEMEEEAKAQAVAATSKETQDDMHPWEKDADWWKKEG